MIFYRFLTWMVSERLPNCNDYKLNNKLCGLTSAVFSVSQVPNCTRIVIAIKHAVLL